MNSQEEKSQIAAAKVKCITLNKLVNPAVTNKTLNIICSINIILSERDINLTKVFLDENLPTKCAEYNIRRPMITAKYL